MVIIMERFDSWDAELYHDGTKGMRWGVRRYQNYDGTLTEAGKARYYSSNGTLNNRGIRHRKKEVYIGVKSASKSAQKARSHTAKEDFFKNDPSVKAGVSKLSGVAKKANDEISRDEALWSKRRTKASAKFAKEHGRSAESDLELRLSDKKLDKSAKRMDKAVYEYTEASKKTAKQILGHYGSKKIYAFYAFGDKQYQKATDVVAKVLTDMADEEYRKNRENG